MSPKASTRLLATQSDERLVVLARAGHERAFEALVQRYRSPLLRYCHRLRLADNRAEDVVQQTLMQAWTALRRGAEVRELRPWLYRIAHNTAVSAVRHAARDGVQLTVALDGASVAETRTGDTPDFEIPGGLALREALNDMAALPQMQREVIFRTAVAGQSHEEVASLLGITDGAVRGLLYRARATLRGALTALTPPPLLAWMADAGQGAGAERVGELAAGGGVGLSGLLVKGGLAALTATLITSAAIVHSHGHGHAPAHRRASRGGGSSVGGDEVAAVVGSSGDSGSDARDAPAPVAGGASSSSRHEAGAGNLRLRISASSPRASRPAPALHPMSGSPTTAQKDPTGSTYTVHLPGSAGGSSTGSSSNPVSPPSGGSAGGTGGGSSGSSGVGGSAGGGSTGGASGGGGVSGGGSGGGSAGGGSGGGSSGGSGSGGSQEPSSPGAGGSGGGSGSGGAGGGSGAEGDSGSEPAPASSPVGTVVHEVTNLLEHTVHGVLGH